MADWEIANAIKSAASTLGAAGRSAGDGLNAVARAIELHAVATLATSAKGRYDTELAAKNAFDVLGVEKHG